MAHKSRNAPLPLIVNKLRGFADSRPWLEQTGQINRLGCGQTHIDGGQANVLEQTALKMGVEAAQKRRVPPESRLACCWSAQSVVSLRHTFLLRAPVAQQFQWLGEFIQLGVPSRALAPVTTLLFDTRQGS